MPNHLTLSGMAAKIQSRELSPVELAEAHLKHIETHNPKLNAFVVLLADEVRECAKKAEEAITRGERTGPLHGVPVTVKDSFDIEGLPTLCGSRFRQDHCATCDSTAAARLRAAGALILGKTNCPEFLMNYETDNHITGRTNNPWNLDRTPGGSSGGESAAISSFCSAGGIGSDGGGSIRVPAHFCGICGLKPTPGRVPATGHYPEIGHPGGLLGVGGPMARNAKDVRLLFDVLAGHDPQDPFSAPVPVLSHPKLGRMKIGMMEQFHEIPVEPHMSEAVQKAAALLEDFGYPVEPFAPRDIESAPGLWSFFFKELPSTLMFEFLAGKEEDAHWTGTELFNTVKDLPEPSGKTVLEKLAARDRMRASLLHQMEQFPFLLWPACGVAAFNHRQRSWATPARKIDYFEAMIPLTPANLLGLPAMVVPFSFNDDGMPLGIQLIGRPYEEERLLELAVRLEEARGSFLSPDGY